MSLIVEVPINPKGKTARFYDDRVEFNEKVILYKDIEGLTAGTLGKTVHTYIGIPVGRSFDGGVRFRTKDGKNHNIVMNSFAMFGIPIIRNPKKYEKLFYPLYEAVYSIVAKNMAKPYIDKIRAGATVEVSGFLINSAEAKPVKSRKPIVITKANYRDYQVRDLGDVIVFDRSGDVLWQFTKPNALLIPYIFDEIFA
ncbi:MAG TPA: hypothetical protein PLL17_02055 [Defluviitaleaceae bacterium]|nr:hypothetical protein [Defluviitaleaceae bacterium]